MLGRCAKTNSENAGEGGKEPRRSCHACAASSPQSHLPRDAVCRRHNAVATVAARIQAEAEADSEEAKLARQLGGGEATVRAALESYLRCGLWACDRERHPPKP